MTEDKEKALLEKIASCLERGDLDECVGDAIASAKELGISPKKLLELSEIQNYSGQFKYGYILALAATDELDEKAPAYHNAGVASYYLSNLEMAEKQFNLAINADPNYALAYFDLGNLLIDLEREVEAQEQWRLAIKSDPNLAAAHYNLGLLLDDLGKKDEAEEQYRLAIHWSSVKT